MTIFTMNIPNNEPVTTSEDRFFPSLVTVDPTASAGDLTGDHTFVTTSATGSVGVNLGIRQAASCKILSLTGLAGALPGVIHFFTFAATANRTAAPGAADDRFVGSLAVTPGLTTTSELIIPGPFFVRSSTADTGGSGEFESGFVLTFDVKFAMPKRATKVDSTL